MLKKYISTTSFAIAFFFGFSLLSNCYCSPVSFGSELNAPPAASHCEHSGHAADAEEKQGGRAESTEQKQNCAPRYNTDNFEQAIVKVKPVAIDSHVAPVQGRTSENFSAQTFNVELKPFLSSSPPIYILVRSLLI